jgi:hypothetical protein
MASSRRSLTTPGELGAASDGPCDLGAKVARRRSKQFPTRLADLAARHLTQDLLDRMDSELVYYFRFGPYPL